MCGQIERHKQAVHEAHRFFEIAAAVVKLDDLLQRKHACVLKTGAESRIAKARGAEGSHVEWLTRDLAPALILGYGAEAGYMKLFVAGQRRPVTDRASPRVECVEPGAKRQRGGGAIQYGSVRDERPLITRDAHRDARGGDFGRAERFFKELRVSPAIDPSSQRGWDRRSQRERPGFGNARDHIGHCAAFVSHLGRIQKGQQRLGF